MDPFAIVMVGAALVVAGWAWFVHRYIPGSGTRELGLRSSQEIVEQREALEVDDISEMEAALEGLRARRRKAGGDTSGEPSRHSD